jgi:DeoR family glycerol-3-phosphate regulon repressor
MAGGELRGDNGAAFGRSAIDFVARFKVKFSIISIGAIGAATGPMDFDLDEAEFANVVLSCGEQAIIVSDHSKFGRQGLIKVCDYDTVDLLITDEAPPADIATTLRDADVEIEIAATPMSEQQAASA